MLRVKEKEAKQTKDAVKRVVEDMLANDVPIVSAEKVVEAVRIRRYFDISAVGENHHEGRSRAWLSNVEKGASIRQFRTLSCASSIVRHEHAAVAPRWQEDFKH